MENEKTKLKFFLEVKKITNNHGIFFSPQNLKKKKKADLESN